MAPPSPSRRWRPTSLAATVIAGQTSSSGASTSPRASEAAAAPRIRVRRQSTRRRGYRAAGAACVPGAGQDVKEPNGLELPAGPGRHPAADAEGGDLVLPRRRLIAAAV